MSLQARIADFLGMVWTQVDNGTDSAAELQEHVATLQQLVVAQRRAGPARTGSSGAAEDSAQLNRVFSDPATEVGTPAAAGSGQAKPERKRHGSAGKGTRQKQESMRNALRQLRRELHKVQAQPAVAARLEKENAASPELGAAYAVAPPMPCPTDQTDLTAATMLLCTGWRRR